MPDRLALPNFVSDAVETRFMENIRAMIHTKPKRGPLREPDNRRGNTLLTVVPKADFASLEDWLLR